MSGFIALAAMAQPAIRPPPPIGTIMASISGASSRNSMAQTPCPATIPSSSKAETKTYPFSASSRLASSVAPVKSRPWITTVAPCWRVPLILAKGVPSGMTMVTGTPSRPP